MLVRMITFFSHRECQRRFYELVEINGVELNKIRKVKYHGVECLFFFNRSIFVLNDFISSLDIDEASDC